MGPERNIYYIIHNNFIYPYIPKYSFVLLKYGLVTLIFKRLCHIITLGSCHSGSDSDEIGQCFDYFLFDQEHRDMFFLL